MADDKLHPGLRPEIDPYGLATPKTKPSEENRDQPSPAAERIAAERRAKLEAERVDYEGGMA